MIIALLPKQQASQPSTSPKPRIAKWNSDIIKVISCTCASQLSESYSVHEHAKCMLTQCMCIVFNAFWVLTLETTVASDYLSHDPGRIVHLKTQFIHIYCKSYKKKQNMYYFYTVFHQSSDTQRHSRRLLQCHCYWNLTIFSLTPENGAVFDLLHKYSSILLLLLA